MRQYDIVAVLIRDIGKETNCATDANKKEKDAPAFASGVVQSASKIKLPGQPKRTKLWQVEHCCHCAVIGTCLTVDEVRKLLESFGIDCHGWSSYALHSAIVTIIAGNDYRTRKVQSYLDRKFKSSLQKVRKMQAEELAREWKNALDKGSIIGAR